MASCNGSPIATMSLETSPDMNESCRLYDFIVCCIVIGIICVSGVAGNTTSFLVLLKHRSDTSAIFLLECMAVSDSILLLASLAVYTLPAIHLYTGVLQGVYYACDYIQMLIWPLAMMAHTATIWLTVLVTANRFCAICRPHSSFRGNNSRVVKMQVLVLFLLSIIYNMPRFFEHRRLYTVMEPIDEYNNGSSSSNGTRAVHVNLGDNQLYQIIYSNVIYFPVMYIIPLSSLGYLNMRLIRALKALRMKKETLTGHRPKEDHISQCVVVLVCVFILCQTPALVNQIFWAALSADMRRCGRFHFYYTKLSDVLVVLNSSCNFVIYCLFGRRFRTIFLETLCKRTLCYQGENATDCTTQEREMIPQTDTCTRNNTAKISNAKPDATTDTDPGPTLD